jgi:1-acyl-sn-glycerol-3-phosphate acyltransferase
MAALRSLAFAILFYGGSVFAVLGILPVALVGGRAVRRYARGWMLFHRWCARRLLGIRTRVEGAVPQGAVLVAAKHQSMYETLELAAMLGDPAVVVKRELARIPLWGWAARRYGVIAIDREGGAAALKRMMRAAEAAAAEGRAILIFPEGTRVAPGETPPLQSGFAGLYRMVGLPVVPIALDSGLLWPRRSFVKRPGTVTFRFGATLPAGLPRKEAEAQVHAAINALEPAP